MQTALDDLEVKRGEVTSAQNDLQATANVVNQKLQESKNVSDQISSKYSAAQQAIADREKRIAQADAEISSIINGDYNNGGGTGQIVGPSNYIYPLPGYRITSGYGPRQYGSGFHYGIDIGAPAGTGIKASRGGTVLVSMFGYSGSGYGGYGNVIVIKHGDGTYTLYGHMSARYVNVGDTVSQGKVIGAVGSTGDSAGNHLHFEIRIGTQKVNPLNYVTPC